LSRWPFAQLRIHCEAQRRIPVAFTGSLIRGAIGANLSGATGLWSRLFGGSPCTRQFALVPPAKLEKGPFSFDVKLLALPIEIFPCLLESMAAMGGPGMGGERLGIAVRRIESLAPGGAEGVQVLGPEGGPFPEKIQTFSAARIFDGDGPRGEEECPGETRRITLLLKTPLRMRERGRIGGPLGPERMVRAALRRLIDLGFAQGQSWPRAWPGVLGAASRLTLISESTRWLEWGRFSQRQGRSMRLGGWVGRVEYGAVPGGLIPLLRAAAFAHFGKNATFGLGHVEVVEAP